jgi:hypothetical protein
MRLTGRCLFNLNTGPVERDQRSLAQIVRNYRKTFQDAVYPEDDLPGFGLALHSNLDLLFSILFVPYGSLGCHIGPRVETICFESTELQLRQIIPCRVVAQRKKWLDLPGIMAKPGVHARRSQVFL